MSTLWTDTNYKKTVKNFYKKLSEKLENRGPMAYSQEMKFKKKHWEISTEEMVCRNSAAGIEVSFIATNRNELFGVITNTETGLHQYVASIDCDLDCIHEQLVELARYYFAKKYYKRNNPYKRMPEMPKETPLLAKGSA